MRRRAEIEFTSHSCLLHRLSVGSEKGTHMLTTWKLPNMAFGEDEGDVTDLYVNEGGRVSIDQDLMVIHTTKAIIDIPSPVSGILVRWHVDIGSTLKIHRDIASFLVDDNIYDLDDPSPIGTEIYKCCEKPEHVRLLLRDTPGYSIKSRALRCCIEQSIIRAFPNH